MYNKAMKKFMKIFASVMCATGIAFMFTACSDNGDKTPSEEEKNPPETVVPSYTDYGVISDGKLCPSAISEGTAQDTDGKLVTANAVIELNKHVILPLADGAEWEISINGTLMPDGKGGGQIFNSLAYNTDGRVYLGVNGGNNVMFLGVCVGDTYANYCWDVPISVMKEEHSYAIKFADGNYTLSVDGETPSSFTSVNVNQSNKTSADGGKASSELTSKICAVSGQSAVSMGYIGSLTHPCTNEISNFSVRTTAVKNFDKSGIHPLSGTSIYYLGSSVTRGHGGNTDGTSFAEMTASLTGGTYEKKAISGTNLAVKSGRNDSYAERLSLFNLSNEPDVLVVQLSTNDFANGIPTGSVTDGKNPADFDKTTLTGAIEYIIATVRESSPYTKVVIYTCPLGESWHKYSQYGEYVNGTLQDLAEKWQDTLFILDLYNAEYVKVPSYIQGDALHPQKEGYAQVFTPAFVNLLLKILN